jgi:hypothetical protein
MALFAYKAVDAEGHVSTGSLDAANAIDLELRLKRLGLDLLTLESVKRSQAARNRRVSRTELITFCFHLSQLLKAGVNIIEALTDLRDTVDNPGFRQVIASLLEDIEGGLKLSEAMANHGYCFDGVFVALVKAGEQSGQLTEVLDELADNLKWQDEMAAQAKKAMVYPAIVFVVIIAVIFVLMIFLVPQLAATFKSMVPKLPRETEALVWLSNIFVRWWYLLIGVPVVLGVSAVVFARTNEGAQQALDGLALKVPVLGPLRQKIILALQGRHQRARLHPDLREDRRQPHHGAGPAEGRAQHLRGPGHLAGVHRHQALPAARAAHAARGRVDRGARHGAAQRELLLQPPGPRQHLAHADAARAGDDGGAGRADRGDPLLDLPADLRRHREDQVLAP